MEEVDLDAVPSDTLAALQYLRSQFPRAALHCPPIVLAHQLYTVVHSKTAVDRDLVRPPRPTGCPAPSRTHGLTPGTVGPCAQETARAKRQLLKFRLPNVAQDIGLLLLDDYRELLALARVALEHEPEPGVAPTITGGCWTKTKGGVGGG